jgi:hypothetical protein
VGASIILTPLSKNINTGILKLMLHPIHRMYIVEPHIVHATTGIGRRANEET